MQPLTGKRALVTAGSRGLGAAIVRELARQGADCGFTYVNDEASAAALVNELTGQGRRARAWKADARDFSRAQEVVAEVEKEFGGLDILVCNAGFARSRALLSMTESDWDDVVAVCLKGSFNYMHFAAKVMSAAEAGKIVCIGSINGLRGRIGSASYNAAKAGLTGLVKTAAAELGVHDINVNLVAPGYIDTPSQTNTPEIIKDLVIKECAIKRLGTPQDIAPVVAFLVSDAARHITGQTIKVDAGQYL